MRHIRDYFLSLGARTSASENKEIILDNITSLFLRAPRGKELESAPL